MEDQITEDFEYRIQITEDEREDHHQYFDGRRMHRVPNLVRKNKHDEEDYYAPKMVSFGPYYHGLPELARAEIFKHEVLAMFVSRSGEDRQFFYCQIFNVIDQIINCYIGISRDVYDDGALAEMILLDASFAIYLMKVFLGEDGYVLHFHQHLGIALIPFTFQDLCLLDNQIPLWVIELLTLLIYGNKEEGPMLISEFSERSVLPATVTRSITGKDKMQPLHLVGAFHQLLVEEWDNAGNRTSSNPRRFWKYNRQSHSVTDLKAKGIHFKPSSYCLTNITFKSYTFYGQLQLPILIFTTHSKLFFEQMIAYEASPESVVGTPIICYVNFLKSLIVKSEDVKELREKKILFSTLDSDEKVVEAIKEIKTCELNYDLYFDDVRKAMEYCSSKAKTWIADFINTYFRNPWTFIALVAVTFLLCLTFLQTYYTMNLPK